MKVANRIFSDYGLIDMSTVQGRQKFWGAVTHFMKAPRKVHTDMIKAGTTQFTAESNFADEIVKLIERYHLGISEIDAGYLNAFDVRNFQGVGSPGFRVRDVQSGLSFSARGPGGRARIYKITGTEAFAPFDTYGGGLEIDQAWFQDQEWWLVEDTAAEFRAKWYKDKATVMYTLLGSFTSSYNTAYDTAGSTALDKDINTLNAAAAVLLTRLNAAGYAVTLQTPLIVFSPVQLMGRLNRALAAIHLNAGVAGAALKVEYAIRPIYSMNLVDGGSANTTKWQMCVPGIKNKLGEKMPLTVYADFKAENFVTTTVGWGRYGAYLNETQMQRLATA